MSVAAGPVGRSAEVAGTAGNLAAIFSYSKTKGLFAGISLEGSVIVERKDANERFYGQKISAKKILEGGVPRPQGASDLYKALDRITSGDFGRKPTPVASMPNQILPSPANSLLSAECPPSYSNNTGYVSPTNSSNKSPPPVPTRIGGGDPTAVALYDFVPERKDDLAFRQGDYIVVTRKTANINDWWSGRLASQGPNGQIGNFPANYVQLK